MRHSNTLWMLAIVTAIFVLIFFEFGVGVSLYSSSIGLAYYLEFRK